MSISIETVIIFKNINDVIEIKEGKYGLSLYQKLRLIMTAKKNPVLLTILTENLITFCSTMIPIICQLMYYFFPTAIWGLAGGTVIGLIQM